jgi:hypothetical protein
MMKDLFSCLILVLLFSCEQDHTRLGIEIARQELRQALTEKTDKPIFVKKMSVMSELLLP